MSATGALSGAGGNEFGRRDFILAALIAWVMALRVPRESWAQTTKTPRVRDFEEYAVYVAVLSSQLAGGNARQLVFRSKTLRIMGRDHLELVASDVEADTLSDYKAKNEKPALLERRFDLKTPYVLANDDELDDMFTPKGQGIVLDWDGGWSRFYRQYPGAPGLITFSRVGFDLKKGQALVYFVVTPGTFGGSSRYLVLSKTNKTWEVQKQIVTALS